MGFHISNNNIPSYFKLVNYYKENSFQYPWDNLWQRFYPLRKKMTSSEILSIPLGHVI